MIDAPNAAESLVHALENAGTYVDGGRFSIEPRAAREKLRAHRLTNPLAYLLLLVEAAYLAGGRRAKVDFTLGTRTTAHFAGISLGDLLASELFSSVFIDAASSEVRIRVLQRIALAANAAFTAGARRIYIDNVDAGGRLHRLLVTPDAEPRITRVAEGHTPGFTRFEYVGTFLDRGRAKRERALLESHVQHSDMNIFANGKQIAMGMNSAFAAFGRVSSTQIEDQPGVVGRAAQTRSDGPAQIMFFVRGVFAETVSPSKFRRGFFAVVDGELRKDLSGNRIVRDELFEAVLGAVEQAQQRLPEAELLPRSLNDRERSPGNSWSLGAVMAMIMAPFCLWFLSRFSDSTAATDRPLSKLIESCARGNQAGCHGLSEAMDMPAHLRGEEETLDRVCADEPAQCYKASRRLAFPHADRLVELACRAEPKVSASCESEHRALPRLPNF